MKNESDFYVIKMAEDTYYVFPDKNQPLYTPHDFGGSVGNPLFASKVYGQRIGEAPKDSIIPQKVKDAFPKAKVVKIKVQWEEE